jgi:DNA-binding CsgD family transcriptional regulator
MAAERARADLDALAASGLDTPTFAAAAFETLRGALPFAAACLGVTDPATFLHTGSAKWRLTDERDDVYAHYEYEIDDLYDFHDVVRRPGGVAGIQIETGGEPRRLRRFAEFLEPTYRFVDELRAAATVEGATWGYITLFRDAEHGAFAAAEAEFLSSVGSTLGRGLRAGLVVGAMDGVAAPDGPAVLVVDAAGEVVQAGLGAAERVAQLGGGPVGESPLPFVLRALVGAARQVAKGRRRTMPRARARSQSGQWLVAHASPLAARSGTGGDVVVTIEEAGPPDIVPLVVAAYGLSPREQEVVHLVLQGMATPEIARTLLMSPYTVQDHLKSIFDKVGVRSRRELSSRVFLDQYAPRLAAGAGIAPNGWFAPA